MKIVKVYWTPFSLKCLDEIKIYLEQASQSETLANKYINKIIDRIEQLKIAPKSGQEEELLKHLKQNSRYLIEGNYKIIYQYKEDRVIITDVFHVKQNPIKIIKRNKT
jgi:toxin ParE1/3/4